MIDFSDDTAGKRFIVVHGSSVPPDQCHFDRIIMTANLRNRSPAP